MNSKDTQVEILSSHYSETFSLLKSAVEKRDRLFSYILIVTFILLLYMSAPTVLSDWLNSFVRHQAGNNNNPATPNLIESSFVGAILLLGLLSLSHTYFQTVLHIERQYDYVYQIEKQLSKHFKDRAFVREGKHYRDHKRKFAAWTKIIFWYLFPLLFLVFNIIWIIFLFTKSQASPIYLVIDSLITLSIFVSLGLYVWALMRRQ
jgi:hypothetical protein